MRAIEVIATVRSERTIEAYETTLVLTTVAGRRVTCIDQANQLRAVVLTLLHQAGLSERDVTEGGGEVGQNYWSSSKSVVHRIRLRHQDMAVLMAAMAATEKHFAAIQRPWYGRIKQSFSFVAPKPVYAATVSADESLREALRNARRTAELIAKELGCRLTHLLYVGESNAGGSSGSTVGAADDSDGEADLLSDSESLASITYSQLPLSLSRATRRFCTRFAIEDAEQSHAPAPPPSRIGSP